LLVLPPTIGISEPYGRPPAKPPSLGTKMVARLDRRPGAGGARLSNLRRLHAAAVVAQREKSERRVRIGALILWPARCGGKLAAKITAVAATYS
jgi:hypothetical protein